MDHLGSRIFTAVLGLALLAGGLIVAADFRGATRRGTAKIYESWEWVGDVPPLLWVPQRGRDPVKMARQFAWLGRIIGAALAIAGLVLILAAVTAHFLNTST
jgi:hypothetical protein